MTELEAEVSRLKRDLAVARMEHDILKNGLHGLPCLLRMSRIKTAVHVAHVLVPTSSPSPPHAKSLPVSPSLLRNPG